VRTLVMLLLFVVGSTLAKPSAVAGVVAVAVMAGFAPMLLMMVASHPLEHGCAGPVRAFTIGMPLAARHLPAHSVRSALREITARVRTVKLSGSAVRSFAKAVGPPLVVTYAFVGAGLCLYRYQSHRGAFIYGAVVWTCLVVLYAVGSIPALRERRAARRRVRALCAHGNAFALSELMAALSAVQSKWEMTATLRAIASDDALPPTQNVDLLTDFALLTDPKLLERGLTVRTEMYTWLTSDPAIVTRLVRLVTHEGADEIIRLADARDRRASFQPLTQHVGTPTR